MNEFDDLIKQKVKEEAQEIPNSAKIKIDETLSRLPEKEHKQVKCKVFPKVAVAAACFLFICFIVMPNCSTAYALALEKIPVIGSIVKVVTIRNYYYSDENHEMNIEVPKIESENNDAVDYINKNVQELTEILADRFNADLKEIGDSGHGSIYADYEVVTNSEKWFTLKIRVNECAGSGNTYYKFYHIDKTNGKIVNLGDLSDRHDFYAVLENEIRRQMREIMADDSYKVYWVDDAEIGQDFVKLDETHNFYWKENGDLVIVFDKYEVAPGYMGTPEFTIGKDVFENLLSKEYR